MVPFMASVTLGMILFVLSGIWISKGRKTPKGLQHVLAVISGLLFIYLTAVLGLRWYVSGHAPFAGSYSVMMLMAWMSALFMTIVYRKFPLAQPLGFLLAGFTMLMASMASANPQITHLMPVLQSPLLSIHVLAMMISYTLFGLIALNGVMGLVVPAGEPKDRLRDISLVILYPALFLLTFGTFLGAVWANISWGSYWQWDPKETWALVTILVYLSALHGTYRSARAFHLFCIFAFLSVLITYFGVNVILGGMHSYA
jgi:ABC-type transport system involved in cytochrome c biogenesis permease subunit